MSEETREPRSNAYELAHMGAPVKERIDVIVAVALMGIGYSLRERLKSRLNV